MLTKHEREQIQAKAIEQAMQAAQMAKAELEPLLPAPRAEWPFALTQDDRAFLKIQKISPA